LLPSSTEPHAKSPQLHHHRAPRSFSRRPARECVPARPRLELRPLHPQPRVCRAESTLRQLGGFFHLP